MYPAGSGCNPGSSNNRFRSSSPTDCTPFFALFWRLRFLTISHPYSVLAGSSGKIRETQDAHLFLSSLKSIHSISRLSPGNSVHVQRLAKLLICSLLFFDVFPKQPFRPSLYPTNPLRQAIRPFSAYFLPKPQTRPASSPTPPPNPHPRSRLYCHNPCRRPSSCFGAVLQNALRFPSRLLPPISYLDELEQEQPLAQPGRLG